MKLLKLIESILIENQMDNLKQKYLGEPVEGETHRKLSDDEFKEILDVTNGKFNLTTWLTTRVANDLIHTTDIYKFKEYFEIFEKNKNKFDIKDINHYKTKEEIKNFINQCIKIREKNVELSGGIDDESKEKYVTPKEIEKLESVGIRYMGMCDGYQIFEIPNKVKDNESTWKVYRDILGRCAGRDTGAKIDICTIQGFNHFQYYMTQHGGSYFLMFNMGDPQSPYQLHFESNQFMDRQDNNVL